MLRSLFYITAIIVIIGTFFSCQKEYSIELPVADSASGSLQDSAGNCLYDSVYGTYYNGITPGSDTDYVQVKVNVVATGSYSIHTDLQNGFEFADSGFFSATGINVVNLKPVGTPILNVPSTFTVSFDSSSCMFTVNVKDSTGHGSGGVTPTASFTLDGAPNACTNAVVNGNYYAATALSATNTVVLPVTVTTAGTYSLTTNTINGYKFSASGTFSSAGSQNITLTASGTPAIAESDAFTPQAGTSSCTFNVTVAPAVPPAVFTLAGEPGACTSPVINGNYSVNAALNSSNTVVININVTTAGSYTLSTNIVNGISFSGSGVFAATGIQNVTLTGTGTPAAGGVTTLTPQIGTSSCTFDVNISSLPAGVFTCDIDGVHKIFNDNATAVYQQINGTDLYISGYVSEMTSNEMMDVDVANYQGSNFPVGTYQNTFTAVSTTFFQPGAVWLDPVSDTRWSPQIDLANPNNWDPFTITITSISAASVQGTFSGTIRNLLQGGTLTKQVTNGLFNVPFK